MNHNTKINYYKTKFKFYEFFHSICYLLFMPIILALIYFFYKGNEAFISIGIVAALIDGILFVLLTCMKKSVGKSADNYCSKYMLQPILSEMFNISSFEVNGSADKRILYKIEILPDGEHIMVKSKYKGFFNNRYVEGFDFAAYTRINWGLKAFDGKGHFSMVKLQNPFPGKLFMWPKSRIKRGEIKLGNLFKKNKIVMLDVADMNFPFDVYTNNVQAANYVLSAEVLNLLSTCQIDKRHVPKLQFDGPNAYVYLADGYWPFHKRNSRDDDHDVMKSLINVNGIWGATDATDIENRMKTDWNEMMTLMSICARY